jgi:response regulator RpfG family c-di-GMP phosphodiesterase
VERAVLSINSNSSMNLVLKNIFNRGFVFYPAPDVYAGFALLKKIKEIDLIVIDLDENCKDCLDFIYFINSSKMYKRKLVVLGCKDQLTKLNFLKQSETVQILLKPFSPSLLVSNNYQYLKSEVI